MGLLMSAKRAALCCVSLVLGFLNLSCRSTTGGWKIPTNDTALCVAGLTADRRSYKPAGISLPLEVVARFNLSSAVSQHLCAAGDHLFVPTLDGRLTTIDLHLLKMGSKKKLPGNHAATVATTGRALLVAMRFGRETLLHYDLASGRQLWEIDAGDIDSEPLVADSLVFVTAIYQHVDAYRLQNGSRRWQFPTDAKLHASPALSEGVLVVASDNGKIYGLEAMSGKKRWEFSCNAAVLATPAIHQQRVFIGTARDSIFAINLNDGALLWKRYLGAKVMHSPAAHDGVVIFASSDGAVRAFNAENGSPRWVFRAESVIGTSPLLTENLVIVGSLDHFLYALDSRTGEELWKYKLDGRVRTNPILVGKYLVAASEDRFVYIFGRPNSMPAN
jgi:outer membrane protein assembly factor BamB